MRATNTRRGRRLLAGGGLLGAGAVAGVVLAGTLAAGASTPSSASLSSTSTGSAGRPAVSMPRGGCALSLSGTVTAVGAHTVTIRSAAGRTVTYAVTSTSDIDKNGESRLSALAAGDAVRFSVRSGTTTIDRLHAGNLTADLPRGGAPAPGVGPAAPMPAPGSAAA